MIEKLDDISGFLDKKYKEIFRNAEKKKKEIEPYFNRFFAMFSNSKIYNYILGPFRKVFLIDKPTTENKVRNVITKVAFVNMVIAGLPGKLGVGVIVSMALEAYMAYAVARHVGLKVERPLDVLKYFTLLSGVIFGIIILFKQVLGFVFSLFAVIPGLNATMIAEFFVTIFFGVLFWAGFKHAKESIKFEIPITAFKFVADESINIFKYQFDKIKKLITKENITVIKNRLGKYINGEIVIKPPVVNDEVFMGMAFAVLLTKQYDSLQGPMGKIFIDSIRQRYPKLQQADMDEMSDFFSKHNSKQLEGDINLVKGKVFENIVAQRENTDNDAWTARLYDNETHPSTDIIYVNTETDERYELSLKATDNPGYIEETLARYPDDKIMTTEEVCDDFRDSDKVEDSGVSNEHITTVTKQNFDTLLHHTNTINVDTIEAGGGGALSAAVAALWPYVIAFARKRIDKEQLQQACVKIIGTSGKRLAVRLTGAVALGPLALWMILAHSVLSFSNAIGFGDD